VLASSAVSGRPIFHAGFGEYLAKLREERTGWTQSDAARFGSKHSPLLTRQVLLHLEAGKTKDPDPEVLRALATLYGVSYEQIAGRFIAQRYGIEIVAKDLVRQGGKQGLDLPERRSDVQAAAASSRLQQRHDQLVTATTDAARVLLDALAAQGVEVKVPRRHARPRKGQPIARGRARNTG
jgi:transcriptional regulator with XRE-family HTH domain